MLRRVIFIGLIIINITKGVFAGQSKEDEDLIPRNEKVRVQEFSKSNDRVLRSSDPSSIDCKAINFTRNAEATYGHDVTLTCSCPFSKILRWYSYDGKQCNDIMQSDRVDMTQGNITITAFNHNDTLHYVCNQVDDDGSVCFEKIDLTAEGKTPTSGSGGAGAVVVVVLIAVILVVSLCCVRQKKAKVSLCFRDTFKANDGSDGKEFDAYVSTGYTEIDRKFIESFVNEILQKKYRYRLVTDNKNILPKLDYSPKLRSNINQCRRLIVVFSPSYMTHDWCLYCFNEGLRKIAELHMPTIFIITDHTMRAELYAHNDVIAHIPQVLLTQYQSPTDKQRAVEIIRQLMPPPMKQSVGFTKKNGMRSPIMSDAESIHRSDSHLNGTSPQKENEREYTFGVPPQQISEEIEREYDEALEEPGPDDFVTAVRGGEDIDPERVQVNQYGARKDFYSLTMTDGDV